MWAFLIDEDMPRSTARVLAEAGHEAVDIRDVGLRGHSDREVFAYAQMHELTLVTADLGFSNVLAFPIGTHAGIVVLRFPNEISTLQMNARLLVALSDLRGEELRGCLVIVEAGRTRRRRP